MKTLVILALLVVAVPARAEDDKVDLRGLSQAELAARRASCEKKWPKLKRSSPVETRRCVEYWLFTYRYGIDDDPDLSEDGLWELHFDVAAERLAVTLTLPRARWLHMAALVEAAGPIAKDDWVMRRGLEMFRGAADALQDLWDTDFMDDGVEEALTAVRAGMPIATLDDGKGGYDPAALAAALQTATPVTLWKLRNAVFARHGFSFKNADLNDFFYGPRKPNDAGLPWSRKDGFTDKLLTPVDQQLIRAIKAEEKRR